MTQDELIDLAKQANGEPAWSGGVDWTWQELETFYKLAAAKERKACAKACAELGEWSCVHAIESRGEA